MPEPSAPPAVSQERIAVCASHRLADGGTGQRFAVAASASRGREKLSGFVIRFEGTVFGYLNQCAHVPSELDWQEGQFFDHSGLYLMCSTHGAIYEPESGRCAGGPCRGGRLKALSVVEDDGVVYWLPDDMYFAPPSTQS